MKLKQVFDQMTPDSGQKKRMLQTVLKAQIENEKKMKRKSMTIRLAFASLGIFAAVIGTFAAYNAVKRDSDGLKNAGAADSVSDIPATFYESSVTLQETYAPNIEPNAKLAEKSEYTAEIEEIKELYSVVRDTGNYYNGADEGLDSFDEKQYQKDIDALIKLQEIAMERFYRESLPQYFAIPISEDQYSAGQSYFENAAWLRVGHFGMDFVAETGTEIYAAADGIVTEIYNSDVYNDGYGKYVAIDHGNNVITLYSQCSEIIAETGQTIKQGDLIALVGDTGWSTGPHLHFELRIDGLPYDPRLVLGE